MKKTLLPIHILFLIPLVLWSSWVWNGTDAFSWLVSVRNFVFIGASGLLVRFGIKTAIDGPLVARLEHRLITALILFLLFDPLTPWWVFLALGAVTELGQYGIRTKLGPLFNPAALGALIVSFLGFFPSWWGTNPAPRIMALGSEISVFALIMALGALYVAYRYRKLPIFITTLGVFMLCYFLMLKQAPWYIAFEGTLLFFVLVMACEPKTSPNTRKEQIIYGIIIGILAPLGLYLHFTEASLIALLVANLYSSRRFLMAFFLTQMSNSSAVSE